MDYTIPVKRENYTRAVLEVLNPFLRLTEYEQALLATMITSNIKVIDTKTRQDLMILLDTDYYTLSNYIKKLKDKELLVERPYGLGIDPNLLLSLDSKQIVIKFKIEGDEDN